MHSMSRCRILGICCLTMSLALPAGLALAQEAPAAEPPPPPADPLAVLKVVPADATAVLAIRNLKEVDTDIVTITTDLGFPLAAIGFPNPLEFMMQNVGIAGGLNENAGMAVAILSCAQLQSMQEIPTRIALLIPCADAKMLTNSMKPQEEGGLIKLNFMGQPSVAALKDGFLVVAQTPDVVGEIMQAKGGGVITAMSPDRVAAYTKLDAMGWLNFRGLSPAIRQEVTGMLMAPAMMVEPALAQQVQSSVQMLNDFIDQSQEHSIGLMMDAKIGVKLSLYGRMQAESEFGKALAEMKGSDSSLLTGLLDEPALLAGGSVINAKHPMIERMLRQSLDVMVNEQTIGGEIAPEQLSSVKESLIKILTGLEGAGFSVTALPADSTEGMVGVAMVCKVANGGAMQAELRELFATFKKMLLETAVAQGELTEEQAKQADAAIQWKENAENLSGAPVDHFVFDLAQLPDMEASEVEKTKGVIGEEGILVRIALVGNDHLALTFGGGPDRLADVVDSLRKGEAPLAERAGIKTSASRLASKNVLQEGYLGVDQIMTLVMDIGKKLDQPMMLPLAMKETAPIALRVTQVDKSAMEAEILVPIELAKGVMDMVGPMMGMMMGGMGGPGGPGGGGPPPGGPPPDDDPPPPLP